ncbi:MAG: gamma carbonic anhydrase family protein [Burkholderiaceae bacterium]
MHLIAYNGSLPLIAAPQRGAQAGHAVIGRVTLGPDAWLGAGCVIRADGHYVQIGHRLHLGRAATIHIAHDLYPTLIGNDVCVGADAVVHACTVGDDVVVEERAIILDGSVVGAGALLEAGSIVYPRSELAGGFRYAGQPARAVRPLSRAELLAHADQLRARNEAADAQWACRPHASRAGSDAFIADTCDLVGDVALADGASIWFGCRLDARTGPIALGVRCNVQDNSVLTAGRGGLTLGPDTTIGHNVVLTDCTIGARCLVGIGSRIAAGTVIPDDTFVAGGCVTEPGQQLEAGQVWGGRPARPIGKLDDAKRASVLKIATVYARYAREMSGGTARG